MYLKFRQILANLVRRAKGTQRHIRSIAEVRRLASASSPSGSRMDNFITRIGGLVTRAIHGGGGWIALVGCGGEHSGVCRAKLHY